MARSKSVEASEAVGECSLRMKLISNDPGVRREMKTVRWRLIRVLLIFYTGIFFLHAIFVKSKSDVRGISKVESSMANLETNAAVSIKITTKATTATQRSKAAELEEVIVLTKSQEPQPKTLRGKKPRSIVKPMPGDQPPTQAAVVKPPVEKITTPPPVAPQPLPSKSSNIESGFNKLADIYKTDSDMSCEKENANQALTELVAYRKELKNEKPPLVLGGIGDSGTRAIAYLVTQLGVWMGQYGLNVKKDSRDSRFFINGFPTVSCDDQNETAVDTIKSYTFYSKSIEQCGNGGYERACVYPKTWNIGVQWTASLFRAMLNNTREFSVKKANKEKHPFGLWGFKHPRSSFILPYIHHVNGDFKYIHIIRDGRDISAGDNTLFFNTCKRYYGGKFPCEDTYEMRLDLWSRLNLDVLAWAKKNLREDQFLVVRIEDLVKGHRACFERISKFIGTSEDRGRTVIDQSIRLFTVKQDRYFGQKYVPTERILFTDAVKGSKWAQKAFKAFGYSIDEWTTTGDCESLNFPMN